MKWYRIPDVEDINKPFITKIKIADKSICVVGYNGELFAVSAVCPHQGFDLSYGYCENKKIICPAHGYSFDLQTGKGSEDYLKTYAVKAADNVIYVGISSVWDNIKQLFIK
jgi:nitrite reductase/ring-hydroxylating ferredoxin subunit